MARIYKYMLGALVLVIVVAAAIAMARAAGLLGGALVLLVVLIGVLLAVRSRVNRDERSAKADWQDVIDDQPAKRNDFTDWMTTPITDDVVVPALHDERRPPPAPEPDPLDADIAPAPADDADEADEADDEAPAPYQPVDELPADPDWMLALADPPTDPFADDDGFSDAGFPTPDAFASMEPHAGNGNGNGHGPSNGHSAGIDLSSAPAFDPVPVPRDDHPADALAYVGAAAASNGQRRSIIDWSGPVEAVEAQVHTNEDILEVSAATALPTGGDRPAPAAGSELARLLAKVEARLRDYE